ncbi:hypothetical protein EDB85DRAFT_1996101, partial [Lactarius pseudohatsudake]
MIFGSRRRTGRYLIYCLVDILCVCCECLSVGTLAEHAVSRCPVGFEPFSESWRTRRDRSWYGSSHSHLVRDAGSLP